MYKIVLFLLVAGFLYGPGVIAQVKPVDDSAANAVPVVKKKAKKINIFNLPDTIKQYPPRVATIRSAILPGWGQITNRKYWKLPLVYGGIGVTAGIFLYNIKTFKEAKAAYINAIDQNPINDFQIPEPYFSVRDQPERIRSFRNQIRQNVDYSALFFIIFWGLNVVDATVDAHLRYFDVGNNLSLQLKPGYSPLAQTNGISVVLHIGK
jgi:Family of unknown function (DUF5683)